jgi:ligand-binding sensor domain-containing protein
MIMATRSWRLCALLLLAAPALAGVGTWKNFTSMKDVRGIARDGHTYWAATSGGLFRWDAATGGYFRLTNAEGLRSIDLTAVGIDPRGGIWSGTSTGILHVYTPSTGSLSAILDISAFPGQTSKGINDLTFAGDTVLVSTEFGLSIFRLDRGEFGDTFTKFGSIPNNVRLNVNAALIGGGRIWVAITDGLSTHRVASAPITGANLLDPAAWTLSTVGGASSIPAALAFFSGTLYAGTSTGLYYYDGAAWQAVPSLAGKSVVALGSGDAYLAAATASREVWTVTAAGVATQTGTTLPFAPTSVVALPSGSPAVGSLTGGILTFTSPAWSSHVPNGPNASQFTGVAVAPDGTVWGASGESAGQGIYRYDGSQWISFTTANSPLPMNEVYRISVGCNGSVWGSIYGRGIVEIPAGRVTIDSARIYGTNVGMVGVAGDPAYVVTSTVACDGLGGIWTSVVLAADHRVLVHRNSSGAWSTRPLYIGGAAVTSLMDRPVDRCLAVDASGNLWAIVRDPGLKGVAVLGNVARVDSIIPRSNLITSANGLPSDDIKTVVVDKENDLWIGTDRGIGIILDPDNPARSGSIAAYKPLNGLFINTIAVDPLNQKWVGTSEGVVLLSPDGTQQLAAYTVENTQGKLIDNDVKSIAVDATTGTVYFGTTLGLASLTTAAAAPRTEYSKILVYPNPYVIPNSSPVTIDGLTANSNVKILTVDGMLVREIKTPGGRLGFWDGTNESGSTVASGIYLVVGYSEDGSQTGTGKIAVIRR